MGAQGGARLRARSEGASGASGLILAVASAWFAGWSPAARADLDDLRVRLSAEYTYDDNVTRATGDDRLYDSLGTLTASASLPLTLAARTRLLLSASAAGEKFQRYSGLDRISGTIGAEVQYRGSGTFSAPIWSVFARQSADEYDSDLRDGYRTTFGASVRKPWTDRLFLFAALGANLRDGRSTVFDAQDYFLRGNLDYSISRRQTLYLGLEGRDGDLISTARPSLEFLDIAEAIVLDDAFTDTTRYAYRIKGRAAIFTLGYNLAFGDRHALDISYRAAYAVPNEQPSSAVTTETVYYLDNQVTITYLLRF
jgi:hypothetical protein